SLALWDVCGGRRPQLGPTIDYVGNTRDVPYPTPVGIGTALLEALGRVRRVANHLLQQLTVAILVVENGRNTLAVLLRKQIDTRKPHRRENLRQGTSGKAVQQNDALLAHSDTQTRVPVFVGRTASHVPGSRFCQHGEASPQEVEQ